jgi:hypothetical protein
MEDYNFAKAREAWATPVKIVQYNCLCGRTMKFESEHGVVAPQREWVGLTDGELHDVWPFVYSSANELRNKTIYQAIEAKLKEKNG